MSHKLFRLLASLIFAMAITTIASVPKPAYAVGTWYVATTGDDNNDYLSLSTACSTINGAIGKAAAGVYKPCTVLTDTFQLKNWVGLYDGFAGTETARDQRNRSL